ncbi:hypothetical protein KSS87_001756 [Heliosperma pusillum]|nr:hypothetical protein KSS87_001756 [Heliosperma pusillum]
MAHLLDGRASASAKVGSASENLAATFVNAFVNAGFGQGKLMTHAAQASSGDSSENWLLKNIHHAKTSAVACLGMILLWDVNAAIALYRNFFLSNDSHVIAGSLLGVGIANCGINHDFDPALTLLGYIDKEDPSVRIGAIMGLGIAYANTQDKRILKDLTAILKNTNAPLDVIAFTSISLGLVFVGSCNEKVEQAIIDALTDRAESDLDEPLARILPLGLGLLYLGKQESVEETVEVSTTFNEKIRKHCDMTLLSCAYAGTGNVLKVQTLLGECAHHYDEDETFQGPAVLGIAMVAMAEKHGLDMAIRSLEHLLQYGEQNIRRAVPLALGLLSLTVIYKLRHKFHYAQTRNGLCMSRVNVIDTLNRLSRGSDSQVSMAAIISLGLIGAGTNNADLATMLRSLSSYYYYKDARALFCVWRALAGLVTFLHFCLELDSLILGKYHYVLCYLVLAMQPRMLLTVDQNLKPLSVPVRVGQSVDVVGRAGRPRTVTGCQTHSTPVLLSNGDRAELDSEKYMPLSPILEGVVILKEIQDYREDK